MAANDRPAEEPGSKRGPDAAEHVRDLILSGRLRAGDRVRVESIAQSLDVSATPVREALRSLQAQGFLSYEHNRGFVVSRLSSADIRDVYISIGLLAGELAARAATTATVEDLEPIRQIQQRLHRAEETGDHSEVSELTAEFYRQLHTLGQSPKIVNLVLTLDMYTTRELQATIPGWLSATVRFQDLLLAAFDARQPEAARVAVRSHMEHAAELFSEQLETASKPPIRELPSISRRKTL